MAKFLGKTVKNNKKEEEEEVPAFLKRESPVETTLTEKGIAEQDFITDPELNVSTEEIHSFLLKDDFKFKELTEGISENSVPQTLDLYVKELIKKGVEEALENYLPQYLNKILLEIRKNG